MLSRRRTVESEWWEVTFVKRVMIKMLIIRWLMYKIGEQKFYAWKNYKNFVKLQRNSFKTMDLPMGYLKYVVLNKSFPVAILSGSFFFLVLSDMSRFLVFWCT